MTVIIVAAAGLAVAGLPGMLLGAMAVHLWGVRPRQREAPPIRSVLMLLLVELRSGQSALGALQSVSAAFPEYEDLTRGVRIATLEGLTGAVGDTSGEIRGIFSQMARSQRSGAPVLDAVRGLMERDIAAERSRRIERARSLPIRLLVPTALLLLPGLVLMFYAPALLRLLGDLTRPFT